MSAQIIDFTSVRTRLTDAAIEALARVAKATGCPAPSRDDPRVKRMAEILGARRREG